GRHTRFSRDWSSDVCSSDLGGESFVSRRRFWVSGFRRIRFTIPAGRRSAGMVRPYSLDLRERVVARVAAGETCRKVAATFGVSVASVVKWSQRYRATGSPAAKRMGNTRPLLLLAERDWVLGRIAEKSDITLQDLVDELRAAGKRGSYGSVWRFLKAEGIRFKKKPARQRA